MGRYRKKCQAVGEITVVELPEIGREVGTRERVTARAAKRIREVRDGEFDLDSAYVELRSTRRRVVLAETSSISPVDGSMRCDPMNSMEIANCAFEASSLCSCNTSSELVEDQPTIADPAVRAETSCIRSAQLETMTFPGAGGRERNYTSPSSKSRAEESEDTDSTAGKPWTEENSRHGSTVHKMPSESEIEEFFAAAEKDLHKRFAEKYNFDVVKDVPLEGRYEWVRVDGHERP